MKGKYAIFLRKSFIAASDMISEKDYNCYIYKTITNCIFTESDVYTDVHEGKESNNLPQKLRRTLSEIARIYDYDMTKKFIINLDFMSAWQKSVLGDIDKEAALIATEYIIFCCVVDKILDSGRFSMELKKKLIRYINIDSFTPEIPLSVEQDDFKCVFELVMDIREFIMEHEGDDSADVLKDIDRALVSECFMSMHDLRSDASQIDENLLIDKSVKFESSALRLSLLNRDVSVTRQADTIGEIFWLIDDICDLLEDYKSGRINSLLYYKNEGNGNEGRLLFAAEHIDIYISLLKERVDLLKEISDNTVYEYMKEQIWWWLSGARRISGL